MRVLVKYMLMVLFAGKNKIMAKDISLTNPGKRKKSSSNVPLHEEEMRETKVKKKKKKMEVEVSSTVHRSCFR